MAITREKKGALVSEYVEKLRRSQAVIVAEYRGLTVKQLETLRRDLRSNDSELVIAKNTLIGRALTEVGMAAPKTLLSGPTAVAFIFGELAAPTRSLLKYAKDTKIMVIRGGVMGRTSFDDATVQALTDLPNRQQLRGQVVGALQAPLASLVNVLSSPMRGFLNLLNARIGELEKAA